MLNNIKGKIVGSTENHIVNKSSTMVLKLKFKKTNSKEDIKPVRKSKNPFR